MSFAFILFLSPNLINSTCIIVCREQRKVKEEQKQTIWLNNYWKIDRWADNLNK